jgi:hypothetical protein
MALSLIEFMGCFPGLVRQTQVSVESFVEAIERKVSCTKYAAIHLIASKRRRSQGLRREGEGIASGAKKRAAEYRPKSLEMWTQD